MPNISGKAVYSTPIASVWRNRGGIMDKTKKDDLRVVKTLEAIRRCFREMICEMDYEEITIKELTERAMINRKTFYLHYDGLDDLLEELQQEIIKSFVGQNVSWHSLDDIKRVIRFFFEYAAHMPLLHERLLCSGSYRHVNDAVNKAIMDYQKKKYQGAFSENPLIDHLVQAYFGSLTTILYRQWVEDGKRLPIEDLISNATILICEGMHSFVKS